MFQLKNQKKIAKNDNISFLKLKHVDLPAKTRDVLAQKFFSLLTHLSTTNNAISKKKSLFHKIQFMDDGNTWAMFMFNFRSTIENDKKIKRISILNNESNDNMNIDDEDDNEEDEDEDEDEIRIKDFGNIVKNLEEGIINLDKQVKKLKKKN